MKDETFERISYEKWKETATKSLKNLPFERLLTKTLEGINILPLYTREHHQKNNNLLHAVREGISSPQWTIAQQTYATDSTEFLTKARESLNKGNEAIVYDGRWPVEWKAADLRELAELAIEVPIYLFNVASTDEILQLFSILTDADKEKVTGVYLGEEDLPEGFVNMRQAGIDTSNLHLEGADIITELAVSLAQVVAYSEKYDNFKQATDELFVRFAIDTHFFMEIAKLRAFRVLWKALASAYGEENRTIPIFSETALRTYSNLDPYVNLLRGGNEAFSAVLGGTDVLTVHPYNVTSEVDDQSIRYARNTQLVIREETQVHLVLDPAGGSYFMEDLTKEMVEKAWDLFLEIEASGGYERYIASDELKIKLRKLNEKRLGKLATGEHVLVGTTSYADLSSEINIKGKEDSARLAKVYEDYRLKFAENQPKTVLLGFGALKEYKPIADFVKNYLASSGIKALESPEFLTIEDYKRWRESNDYDYGIICTPKDKINQVVKTIAPIESGKKILDVAGNYQEEFTSDWKKQGINGLIYKGQNHLEKFKSIASALKEVSDIEKT